MLCPSPRDWIVNRRKWPLSPEPGCPGGGYDLSLLPPVSGGKGQSTRKSSGVLTNGRTIRTESEYWGIKNMVGVQRCGS